MTPTISPHIAQHDWLITIGLILLGMIIFHWISRITYRFLIRKIDRHKHPWWVSLIESTHVPFLTFFWLIAASFVVFFFMLHFKIDLRNLSGLNTIRNLLFLATIYWTLLRFITLMENEIAPRSLHLPVRDKTTMRALAQLSRVVATILFALSILPELGFRTSSLVAFAGASGIGFGFAAKDTFENVLGGMMIFWDRPFSVGDWISSPDRNIEGTVEHIGWRLTRIRTFSKQPLYVPNGLFSSIVIVNPSRMSNRQINSMIGVRYDDVNVVALITKDIDDMLRNHPSIDKTQTIMVHFTEFAASSLNINVYAFTKTTDWAKYREVQQDVFLKSIAIIANHGAECAFQTITLQGDSHDCDAEANPIST